MSAQHYSLNCHEGAMLSTICSAKQKSLQMCAELHASLSEMGHKQRAATSSIIRPVVISRKLSNTDPQLLWNVIRKLAPQILLLHSIALERFWFHIGLQNMFRYYISMVSCSTRCFSCCQQSATVGVCC